MYELWLRLGKSWVMVDQIRKFELSPYWELVFFEGFGLNLFLFNFCNFKFIKSKIEEEEVRESSCHY